MTYNHEIEQLVSNSQQTFALIVNICVYNADVWCLNSFTLLRKFQAFISDVISYIRTSNFRIFN